MSQGMEVGHSGPLERDDEVKLHCDGHIPPNPMKWEQSHSKIPTLSLIVVLEHRVYELAYRPMGRV